MPLFYKGTNNLKCMNQIYKIGGIYSIPREDVELCKFGFHFCRVFNNVDLYYYFENPKTVILEIEVDDQDIVEENGNKLVASKIEIIRIIHYDEYKTLSNGIFEREDNIMTRKQPNCTDDDWIDKWEYDENNNIIKWSHYSGFCRTWEYNEHNQKIKSIDSKGFAEEWTYHNAQSDNPLDYKHSLITKSILLPKYKYL